MAGLHYATDRVQVDVVEFLLQSGACTSLKDHDVSMRLSGACFNTSILLQQKDTTIIIMPQCFALALLPGLSDAIWSADE